MDVDERARQLVSASSALATKLSPAYDEVVEQVSVRVSASGELGKLDLAALTSWKRLRADTPWMADLMGTPDGEVRRHTARAVAAARDETRAVPQAGADARAALVPLPGLRHGDALASAVCFAAAPHRLAVYDRRAHRGLTQIGFGLGNEPGRYLRYLEIVEQCRSELARRGHAWTARQVDLALYEIGR